MNTLNFPTFINLTQILDAQQHVTATNINTSKHIPIGLPPSVRPHLFRPVRGPVPYISRKSTGTIKHRTGHERESRATGRAILQSWGLGVTQDVSPPIGSKIMSSFWKKLNGTQETVMNISRYSQNAPITNEGRANFSNRFVPRKTACSSPSSMLENMGVSSAVLKTPALDSSVTHEPPSHAPAIDNDRDDIPIIESDIETLLLSVDFETGPSMSAFAQPAFDLSDNPGLLEELDKFWDKGTPSSNSRSSLPSPKTSAPILHLPMGQRPEEGLGHASEPGAIAGNYIPYAYAEQVPIERPPEHQNTSAAPGRRYSEESGQHCAREPSFSGTEMVVGQGAERMGVIAVGASSSYGLPRESKGRKRERSEIGDADEESTAGPARQKLRSDRTLGATVPRSSAFMAGQQWGLEPLQRNQAIGMGSECDGEGRPLNLSQTFSLGRLEG